MKNKYLSIKLIAIWSIPWCTSIATVLTRRILEHIELPYRTYNISVGMVMLLVPIINLCLMGFNSFSRITTIVLLTLYVCISPGQAIIKLINGYQLPLQAFIFIPLVVGINIYCLWFLAGKHYHSLEKAYLRDKHTIY